MGVEVTYRCDICRTVKGDTNHWYLARAVYSDNATMAKIVIERFNTALAGQNSIICGENCIHKFISQNLNILQEDTELEASSPEEPEEIACTCFLKGDVYKAPEQHALDCPWRSRNPFSIKSGEYEDFLERDRR